ncbi:MAG: hypothetical protein LUQ69_10250, partial [Methanoregulaceae archaeon]|nr:hypothetical protein [Methanoregulaceae archaeon]
MYPKRMERVEITLLRKDLRPVLDVIRSARIIDAIDLAPPREGGADHELISLKGRVEHLIEALAPHEPPVKGLANLLGVRVQRLNVPERELKSTVSKWLKQVEGEVLKVDSVLKGIEDDLETSSDIRQRLLQLSGLDLALNDLRTFKFVKVRVGLTRRFGDVQRMVQDAGGSVQGSLLDRREGLHAVRLIYPVSRSVKLEEHLKGKTFSDITIDVNRIESFLRKHGADSRVLANSVGRVLEELENVEAALFKKRAEVSGKAGELAKKLLFDTRAYDESIEIALEKERFGSSLPSTVYTRRIVGWVESKRIAELEGMLRTVCGQDHHLSHRPPTAEECDGDKVPTKMENRWLGRLFEGLTRTYSIPKYNEIDPSAWMAVPFIVIFGIMLGDIGYASLMVMAGIFIIAKSLKGSFISNVGWLVLLMGISASIAGLWMGSFFGDLASRVLYGDPTHPLYSLEIGGYKLP